ncbi:hypothetical protein L1281_001061 [Neisseria sp. HSC-16F19]|nr:SMI1/KNR4 family protein [Neisseria sp. HSC-16F19]MCP2040478.1 hypothetical protein [Neisseria sp. HSC-16F19]
MTDIIQQFAAKARAMGKRNLFNAGATDAKIAAFAERFGFELPPLVAGFYRHFDGGCFADDTWCDEELADPDQRATILWNSHAFLSLDEIIHCTVFDSVEVFEDEGRWFIPLLRTPGHEVLVLEQGHAEVLDAFHEYLPEDWLPLYPDFASLLQAYIDNEGEIETIAG